MIFGGKLIVASPLPFTDLACNILKPGTYYPTGSSCTPISVTPLAAVGYSSLDLQVTKELHGLREQTAYVRVDLINALNSATIKDVITNYGSGGVATPTRCVYNTTGNIKRRTANAALDGGLQVLECAVPRRSSRMRTPPRVRF